MLRTFTAAEFDRLAVAELKHQLDAAHKQYQDNMVGLDELGSVIIDLSQHHDLAAELLCEDQQNIDTAKSLNNLQAANIDFYEKIISLKNYAYYFQFLIGKIIAFIEKYEDDYPSQQSNYIRDCLGQMPEQLEQIVTIESSSKDKVYLILGLVQHWLDIGKDQYNDKAFIDSLNAVLMLSPIQDKSLLTHYRQFINFNRICRANSDYLNNEPQLFFDEYNRLNENANTLYAKTNYQPAQRIFIEAIGLAEQVMHELNRMQENFTDFDYKFHTNLLYIANELTADITNTELQEKFFQFYAKLPTGQWQPKYLALGAGLMFLALLIISAAIYNLINRVTLNNSVSGIILVLGTAMLATGAILFNKGKEHGVYHQCNRFFNAINSYENNYTLDTLSNNPTPTPSPQTQ